MKRFLKKHNEIIFPISLIVVGVVLIASIALFFFNGSTDDSNEEQALNNDTETDDSQSVNNTNTSDTDPLFDDLDDHIKTERENDENSFYNSGTFENAQLERKEEEDRETFDEERNQFTADMGYFTLNTLREEPSTDQFEITVVHDDDDYSETLENEFFNMTLNDMVLYEIEFKTDFITEFYQTESGTVYSGIAFEVNRESNVDFSLDFLMSELFAIDNHGQEYHYDSLLSEPTTNMLSIDEEITSTVSLLREGITANEIASMTIYTPSVYDMISDERLSSREQIDYDR